jgi:hypothetical protein
MAGGGGGGGGGGNTVLESLEQARAVGDSFVGGDVYWDQGRGAVFGKASIDLNKSYGHVFYDKVNNVFVIDSTKDGSGVIGSTQFRMGGVTIALLTATGALVIGASGPVGSELLRVDGDVHVDGGIATDTLSLSGSNPPFIDSADGQTAPVSGANHGRIRYNALTQTWQQSLNGGAYQSISPTNPWIQGGNAFGTAGTFGTTDANPIIVETSGAERFRILSTGELVYGSSTLMAGLETGYSQKWRYTGSVNGIVGGNQLFLVDNSNGGGAALSTILAANEQGCGASITSVSNNWDGSITVGLVAGDAGLVYNTCQDIDPPAGAGLILASGILPVKFVTNFAEQARFTPGGQFLIGATVASDPSHIVFEVSKNQNDYSGMQLLNTTDGTISDVVYGLIGPSGRSASFLMTAPSFTAGFGFGQDQVVIDNHASVGGINLLCEAADPIIFTVNKNEYARFAGDGSGFIPSADTAGSLGKSGTRWGDIWVVNTHIGDLMLDDDTMDSHWTLREAKFQGEDPRQLYAVDRVTGKKYSLALNAVAA